MSGNVIEFSIIGIDKFSKQFNNVQKSMISVAKVTAKVATAAAGVGAAMFAMSKKFADAEDRAAKFAKRIGQSVEELTAIEFAGERAGLSMQQVDMSLQRLERRAAEAAAGMGEARGALRELNINAAEFTKLGLEDKMGVLAKSLEGVTDSGERTRLAFKLFDSEGVAMLQMLGDGEEAFRGLTEEARKFGAVISKEAAANAERFQDSFTNMTTAFSGTFRGIADKVIPIFTNLMDRVSGFFVRNRQVFIDFTEGVIKGFFYIVTVGERVFDGLGKTIAQFTSFNGIKVFAQNFVNGFLNIAESAFKTFASIGRFIIKAFEIAFTAVQEVANWAWQNIKSIFTDESGPSLGDLLFKSLPEATAKARDELSTATVDMAENMVSTFEVVGTSVADLLNMNFDGITTRMNEIRDSFTSLGEAVTQTTSEVAENASETFAFMSEMWDQFKTDQMDYLIQFKETMLSTMETIVDSISNAVASAIVDGGSLMDKFKAIAKSVVKEVIAALVKMAIQRVILSNTSKVASRSEATTEASRSIALTFSNTMASWAGAPWPISIAAPAMAAANAAIASAGYASGAASGAGLGAGIAHGGMTNVPKEATYLLDKGERVLSPNQNSDFTNFINSGGGTGSTVIEQVNIEILPNATNADALLSMSREDMQEVVSDQIIPALDSLGRAGIRPRYIEG
jgi:hypothetical protein